MGYLKTQPMGEIMIPNVSWMVAADTLILFFLSEHRWRFLVTPSMVATNVGMSTSHANRRLKILQDAGMVEQADDRGYYRITDLGERLILGQCTKEELEKLDPSE